MQIGCAPQAMTYPCSCGTCRRALMWRAIARSVESASQQSGFLSLMSADDLCTVVRRTGYEGSLVPLAEESPSSSTFRLKRSRDDARALKVLLPDVAPCP